MNFVRKEVIERAEKIDSIRILYKESLEMPPFETIVSNLNVKDLEEIEKYYQKITILQARILNVGLKREDGIDLTKLLNKYDRSI